MPRAGPRTRMRMRRALNLEHSSCFFVAIDAYCVRYSRFSGYDPSDIGRFRRAVWCDDLKMRRTVAQRGSGGLARRFAPRCGQCLLAGYGVQCRDDVHRSILCISQRSVRRAPGTLGVRGPVHAHQRPAAIFWEPVDHADALAGLTAGTFYPLTLTIVLRNLPIKYLLLGTAMYAMDVVITLNIATSLEAWYMNHLSWHWIFWNNAVLTPVMMVLIYFGIPWQPLPKPKEGQPKPSWQGFFYVSLGFALLYIALAQGQRLNWMNSATIIALVVTTLPVAGGRCSSPGHYDTA